jgi:transcriptional regulator with XRE-family HTH domain
MTVFRMWQRPVGWCPLLEKVDTLKLQQLFGEVVRRRRKQAGLSQEELADRAGVHRTYMSVVERGLKVVSLAVVHQLAEALGTSKSSLMAAVERLEAAAAESPGGGRSKATRDER